MTKISLDDQLKSSIATIRKSIRNGNLKLSPEFLYKVNEVKQQLEKDLKTDQKKDIPFLTLKELEQLIIDDRKAEFDKILLRK